MEKTENSALIAHLGGKGLTTTIQKRKADISNQITHLYKSTESL